MEEGEAPQEKGTSFIEHLLSTSPSVRAYTLAAHRSNSSHKRGSFDPPCVLKKLKLVSNTNRDILHKIGI